MTLHLALGPIAALIAGILILIVPRLLNYIVAIYLIIVGLIEIFGWNGLHVRTTATESRPELIAPSAIVAATDPRALVAPR